MADYEVSFKAPALPYPPKEYNAEEFNQFNNVIRLYFNQIDNTLRDTSLADRSDSFSCFMGYWRIHKQILKLI